MKQEEQISEPDTPTGKPESRPLVVSVAVPLGAGNFFSYEVPESLEELVNPGGRVLVQFGNRHLVGLVTGYELKSSVKKLKPLLSVLDRKPVMPEGLLQLGKWLAWYYMAPPGEMFRCMLPPGLLAKKASPDDTHSSHWPVREQDAIVDVNSGKKRNTYEETGRDPSEPD